MSGEARQVAVVTGAARGIGLAISSHLARAGYRVLLADVLEDDLAKAARELELAGLDAGTVAIDVTDDAAVSALPERIGADYDRVSVLVNNAAISPKHQGRRLSACEIPLAEWEQVLRVNLTGAFRMMQVFSVPMRRRGWGRIVNISSRAGRSPGGVAGAHYVTSKAGVLGMTRAFAAELAPFGITVNAIAPGRIRTPMTDGSDPEVIARARAAIPVGRMGEPDEVGALVAYLASPAAGFMTGATLDINGGVLMI